MSGTAKQISHLKIHNEKRKAESRRRFPEKVGKKNKDGCMNFLGNTNTSGYGIYQVTAENGDRVKGAHRVAFYLEHGAIGKNMCVCHSCDNRLCCNPDHLWEGTFGDNNRDARKKGRNLGTKGMKSSQETRDKISAKTRGKNNPMYGRKHSQEAKIKMSNAKRKT